MHVNEVTKTTGTFIWLNFRMFCVNLQWLTYATMLLYNGICYEICSVATLNLLPVPKYYKKLSVNQITENYSEDCKSATRAMKVNK